MSRIRERCPLDPAIYIVAVAFVRPVTGEWAAPKHGCAVGDVAAMDRCGCAACVAGAARVRSWRGRPAPRPAEPEPEPKRTDAGPVRQHLLELLDAGISRDEIATAAGIDRSTVVRSLKPYVAKVSCAAAAALLAVGL